MSPRQPVTTRRLAAVMVPTIAACIATALILGSRYPLAALLFTAGILVLSSAVLPAPAWKWWFRQAGRVIPCRGRRPIVLTAVLRTAADLACMAGGNVAAAVANRVWIRRLRAMDAYDKDGFCGKGIPRRDWAVFLDQMTSVLGDPRSSEERES